jgi:polyhydroxyalkanoate synthesis regulator phasin
MANNWNNWMNQANQANKWTNLWQQYAPANFAENFKKSSENWTNMFNQFNDLLKTSFTDFQKNLQNATAQDVYTNMINSASTFGKFSEIWAPFWKSVQDKTFNADQFKKAFNPEAYKELMDKFFGFAPESGRQYVQQVTEWWNNGMKNVMEMSKNNTANGRDFFNTINPFANQNVFENYLNAYQSFQSTFQNAISPIAKMVTPNQYTKAVSEWSEIADRMAIFNIKNAELQYMMYQRGNKVMDKLTETVTNKIENDIEINSITALYQEWLNIIDNVYVELFDSDEYSKLMAEVSALQLKLQKDINVQIEKSLSAYPVATRSELDELYKVIYDLKKEVRQLEKMLDMDEHNEVAEKSAATSTRKNSTAKK